MRFRLIALSLTFVVAAAAGVWTRQASPAQLAFEAAKRTETIDRNLPAAIAQYRDVATKYESDLTVAPSALLKMAGCYEELRQPEARETYERIVKYYPDSAPAKAARLKLAGQQEVGLTTTRLTDVLEGHGAPSLDGRYFTGSVRPSGDLAVRDMRSGRVRPVTANAKKNSESDYPLVTDPGVPSPDGRQIAYSWAPSDVWELRVINYDGSQEKTLCCREKFGEAPPSNAAVTVYGWSGDGKQILSSVAWVVPGPAWAFELMTIPAAGGVPRSLKQLKGLAPIFWAAWSPDGQFIIYDAAPTGGKANEHDLFIMRADGSNTEPLVTHTATNKHMLHWFPDGKRILFLSDRTGSNSVWAQTMSNGKAVGQATLVRALVGNLRGQGFTKDGAYFYNVLSLTDDIFTARPNASDSLAGNIAPLPSRFSGSKATGVWSPDGSRIAYVHVPFGVTSGPSLSIQTVSTREVHTIPVQLNRIANPTWMPDGRTIIVEGANTDGGRGLFRIELSSGTVSPVGELATTSAATKFYPAASSNGREVFYGIGGTSGGVRAQDLVSGAVRTVFDGPIMNFALSPDGRFVAIASPSWETPPFRIVPTAGGMPRAIGTELEAAFHDTGFAWSTDSRYLYFARVNAERRMTVWRVPVDGGPAQPTDISLPKQRLGRISVHPDGLLAMSTQAYDIEYWVMRNIPPAAKR